MEDLFFKRAVSKVFDHEGFYTEDHAGPTKYGITIPVLSEEPWGDLDRDGDIDGDDIRELSRDQAEKIYFNQWWERYGYGNIKSQLLVTKVLDLSVNMGPRQCHKLLQRACWSNGRFISVDGILGPVTMKTINRVFPIPLVTALRSEAAGFYRLLVEKHPDFDKFLKGWLKRAYD